MTYLLNANYTKKRLNKENFNHCRLLHNIFLNHIIKIVKSKYHPTFYKSIIKIRIKKAYKLITNLIFIKLENI